MIKRKTLLLSIVFLAIFAYKNPYVWAGEICHYINGSEGIKAATLPPPGFYYRVYNAYYHASELKDGGGRGLDLDFQISAYAEVNYITWITNHKFLGANYAYSLVIPFVYQKIRANNGLNDSSLGLADIIIEPVILGWHGKQFDTAFAIGGFIPTGKYDPNKPSSPGKDHWTGLFTLGGTYYFDEKKGWSAAILTRFEMHTPKLDKNIKAGNDFHFDWGLAKTITRKWIWDVGASGYCHWQLTDDRGSDINWDPNIHDRVFAAGPEIAVLIPKHALHISLRTLWEFGAKDRPEGTFTCLRVVKRF